MLEMSPREVYSLLDVKYRRLAAVGLHRQHQQHRTKKHSTTEAALWMSLSKFKGYQNYDTYKLIFQPKLNGYLSPIAKLTFN